jgi:hypothetical protein
MESELAINCSCTTATSSNSRQTPVVVSHTQLAQLEKQARRKRVRNGGRERMNERK